ncbi:MAG: ATP-binding protein [Coriobacteriales bacterium]|nr:ATP-binding protein [Coriobacteriales bacterium]
MQRYGKLTGASVVANAAVSLLIQMITVLVAMLLDALGFSEAAKVIVFVLGVLVTSLFTTSPIYCLVASALSILCFNFFLVSPRFTLRIEGTGVPGTIAVMFVVALLASYLVTRMRDNERKSAEASLKAQNEQLRANLLRSVSHDLRTPLTAIMGNADILLDKSVELSEKERRRLVHHVYEDATWLVDVVQNLLYVTRLEEGGIELGRDVELVDDVVEEAMRHVSRDAANHNIVVTPSGELLLARMDAQVIVQVVVNLVNNAIMHTHRGSNIHIEVRRVGQNAEVSVTDDGPGINQEDKQRVFEPFYTTSGISTDSQRGMGLGLSLCQSLVEAHGGTLRVENVSPHGSAFIFTLPLESLPNEEYESNG